MAYAEAHDELAGRGARAASDTHQTTFAMNTLLSSWAALQRLPGVDSRGARVAAMAALAAAALASAGALWPIVQQELGKRDDKNDVRKLFRDIDRNGDGRLSIEELEKQLQALCPPTASADGDGSVNEQLNKQLAKRMLDAADTDHDGILTEDEFIRGMAAELRPYLAVCLVPGGLTPHQITFTIPTSLLDSPLEERASPGKLHVRVRLGVVNSADDVEWDDWHNPLQDNSFNLQPRVVDDATILPKLPPVCITDSEQEKSYVHSDGRDADEGAALEGREGQLRHFTITGLLPSCANPIMKRLGLERWRVEVQVGMARGLAWSHKEVHWYQNRTLSRDVPVAEVPEILTSWLEQAVGNHAVPEIIRLLQAKFSGYWSDSNETRRAKDMAKITISAKALQDRLLNDNFLLPLATHPSAACQMLWGLLQSSDVRETTLRDVARSLLRGIDEEGNLPHSLMLRGRTISLTPQRPGFIGMRATPLRAEGWVAPGYNFLETYPTMAGHGGQETVGPEQLQSRGLFKVTMPADCPFAITVIIEVDHAAHASVPQLMCRCVNSNALKLPLNKIMDEASMSQPMIEGEHGVHLHLSDDTRPGDSSGLPPRSPPDCTRYTSTLSFSRTNPRTHPSRPRKPVLEPATQLVLQLAARQEGGEVAWCTIDVNVEAPVLLHPSRDDAQRSVDDATTSSTGGNLSRGTGSNRNGSHTVSPALHDQGRTPRHDESEVADNPVGPPRWQDLFSLLPQECGSKVGSSLNRSLIQYLSSTYPPYPVLIPATLSSTYLSYLLFAQVLPGRKGGVRNRPDSIHCGARAAAGLAVDICVQV